MWIEASECSHINLNYIKTCLRTLVNSVQTDLLKFHLRFFTYVVVGYIFQILTTFSWTIAKWIASVMMETRNEFILFSASSIYCTVAGYRGFTIMLKYKTINTCLNAISEFSLTKVENDIIQQKMKSFSKSSSAYTSLFWFGLVSVLWNPVISEGRELPVLIWIPYIHWKDNDRDVYIAFGYSLVGMSSMVIAFSFTPIIVWYLMFTSSLMLELLGWRLQKLGYKQTDQKKCLGDIVKLIKLHQDIVQYEEPVSWSYTYSIKVMFPQEHQTNRRMFLKCIFSSNNINSAVLPI